MSIVSNSVEQCRTVSNSVNSVNSYSAVLPPSPMVFLTSIPGEVEGNSANSSVAIRGNCPSQLNRLCFLQISKVILFARSHSCVDNSDKNDS